MKYYKTNWIQVYRTMLRMEIAQLRRYAQELESLLLKQSQKLAQDLQEQASKMSVAEQEQLSDWWSDDFERLEHSFPKILRYSLFVHSYSLLEHELLRIADHFRRMRKLKLSPSDLRDEGITRARTYLKKVVSVPFPDTGRAWQDISTLNHIRNLVVHNTGYLPEDHRQKQPIEALMKKWKSDISLDSLRSFKFSEHFIFRVLDTFESFLKELLDNLEKK